MRVVKYIIRNIKIQKWVFERVGLLFPLSSPGCIQVNSLVRVKENLVFKNEEW